MEPPRAAPGVIQWLDCAKYAAPRREHPGGLGADLRCPEFYVLDCVFLRTPITFDFQHIAKINGLEKVVISIFAPALRRGFLLPNLHICNKSDVVIFSYLDFVMFDFLMVILTLFSKIKLTFFKS